MWTPESLRKLEKMILESRAVYRKSNPVSAKRSSSVTRSFSKYSRAGRSNKSVRKLDSLPSPSVKNVQHCDQK